ncbi:MAG: tyrosine-type recombinase/integrase [Vicinamibacterales bacterium]
MVLKRGGSLNALDALASIRDYSRLVADVRPALEAVRQHDEMLRSLTANPVLDALRQQDEMVRQITHNPVVEAMRQHEDLLKQVGTFQTALGNITLHGGLFAEARRIADTATQWRDVLDRVTTDFSNLVPASAFSEVQRLAESVRLSMPTMPAIDPALFTTNWDATLTAAVEHFRQRAENIASDPDADLKDVEALVAQADAVAAATPAEARPAMNVYLKYLLLWLLGVLAEDPVKAAAHHALATLLIFLATIQPTVLPEPPQPPASLAPHTVESVPKPADQNALAVPSGWQIEGLPEVIKRAGPKAAARTIEFFTENIRNPNTRQAYANATMRFFNWCDDRSLELADITPFVVAAYIEELQREASAPTVKQHLAAIRMLFDWLVVGQVLPMNPAASVRGPRHVVARGKTPVLTADQARAFLDSIDTVTIDGLRDRALIGVMVYSFARVSAAVRMEVGDYYPSGKRFWFRLGRNGDKHCVPAHHSAEAYMDAYLETAGIARSASGPVFRTLGRNGKLTGSAMTRTDALRMIKRRAFAAGLPRSTCCHTFRATGITAYLSNGGTIEKAQQIAAHESIRTTKLYDRPTGELTLHEIEKIII